MVMVFAVTMDVFDAKGLSIERLRSFCAVMEHGSITAAADHDPVRQSQFSRQIKELEQTMNVRLFERRNRRLIPTSEGRSLALLTRRYFDGVQGLCKSGLTGPRTITISAGESIHAGMILPRFGRLRELYPDQRFHFQNDNTAQVLQRLQRGEADIGVLRESALTGDLARVFLVEVAYRLVVSRALLPEGSVHGWKRLRGLPIAMLRGGGEFTRSLAALAERVDVKMLLMAEASTFSGLRELVRTGLVAAFFPEWMARSFPDDRFASLNDDGFEVLNRRLYVVTSAVAQSVSEPLDGMIETLARIWRP